MNKKLICIILNLIPLIGSATNNNPASIDYVQSYVAQAIANSGSGSGSGTVGGSGNKDYLPIWSTSTTLGNSSLSQNATGDVSSTATTSISAGGRLNSGTSILQFNGSDVLTTPGVNNLGLGVGALAGGVPGLPNKFERNTAIGLAALNKIEQTNDNTAVGFNALINNQGASNTVIGSNALANITGDNNIGIGYNVGKNISTINNAIYIGSTGVNGDASGTIRIGEVALDSQNSATYLAGVRLVNLTNFTAIGIDTDTGQLGIDGSSRRFKEDIHDMGNASQGIMRLRPVTFRYKKPANDGSKPIQYGLIAEEVEKVYPDLVVYDGKGQILTVKYQEISSLLLNEVQRQQGEIKSLNDRLAKMEVAMASLSTAKTKDSASSPDLK